MSDCGVVVCLFQLLCFPEIKKEVGRSPEFIEAHTIFSLESIINPIWYGAYGMYAINT